MKYFELEWRGGATATRLHKRRTGIEHLPWGTLATTDLDPAYRFEARAIWSNGVFTEYASAAAFSALTTAMLECGAPVDLIAMCGDIVVDEMFHVELSSRLTMELGGAMALEFDLANVAPAPSTQRPLMKAAELAVVTSCVSESLSVPAMARSRVLASEPLCRAVLDRLLVDEGPHSRLGYWFLDWAAERLTDIERAALAATAVTTIEAYASLWQESCDGCPPPLGLGGHDAVGRQDLRAAVENMIARPLARYGIELDKERVAQLVA
ncbi:MAG TPA: hypothetical protein VFV99_15180 [Kofleriaceae bacterium]|nr:hypothetical protein [Kofleriaceae bacterium]